MDDFVELRDLILAILPEATFQEDNDGQIVIYTNYKTVTGTVIQSMAEKKYCCPFCGEFETDDEAELEVHWRSCEHADADGDGIGTYADRMESPTPMEYD